MLHTVQPITASYDPWDPIRSFEKHGRHVLTSVEFSVTNMCNMRCEHCAVGESLLVRDADYAVSLDLLLKRLDEVAHLETISITGGEPTLTERTVRDWIVPLLKYAKERGVRSQLNSNLTLDLSRYEILTPYLDVMHISFNYIDADDFHQIGFARSSANVSKDAAAKLFERMAANARALSSGGMFVSAESMINYRTHRKLPEIHRLIAEMGCRRHEVHPMYESSFAAGLPVLSLEQTREAIHTLLDARDPSIWMLFGTLPFYACSSLADDQKLVRRLRVEDNVTVRNDPDGRNRLNINLFTGDVHVTDFSDVPPLGTVFDDSLDTVFERWTSHPLCHKVSCHCPAARCCGPNLLVADMYYPDVDFSSRRAIV